MNGRTSATRYGRVDFTVERRIEMTTRSIYALPSYLRIFEPGAPLAAIEVAVPDRRTFVYSELGRKISVHTTAAELSPQDVNELSAALFERHTNARVVQFTNAFMPLPVAGSLVLVAPTLEDVTVTLPTEVADFQRSLGKKTRQHSRYYINRLEREFPGVEFSVSQGPEIAQQDVQRIIELNALRMRAKGKTPGINNTYASRLGQLMPARGIVFTWRTSNRLLGGAICTAAGEDIFLQVISHDPQLDQYNVGHCVAYASILWSIKRGFQRYHFLWGKSAYKYRLLGRDRDLSDVTVFRNRLSLLTYGPPVQWAMARRAAKRRVAAKWRGHERLTNDR